MDGWITLHRKLLDSPIAGKPSYLALWITILLLANHQDKEFIYKNKKEICKRGELVTSRASLAQRTGISPSTIEDLLGYFEKEGNIRQRSNSSFRLITVVNYESYQEKQQRAIQRGDSEAYTNNNVTKKQRNNITTPTPSLKTYTAPDGTPRTLEQIAQKILDHFRVNHIGNFKTYDPFISKLDYWLGVYSLEDIQNAIVGVSKDKFWKDKMTPTILFRRKNPQGEGVDYIGDMLHVYRKTYVRPDQT